MKIVKTQNVYAIKKKGTYTHRTHYDFDDVDDRTNVMLCFQNTDSEKEKTKKI